jgi:hypothetical protein
VTAQKQDAHVESTISIAIHDGPSTIIFEDNVRGLRPKTGKRFQGLLFAQREEKATRVGVIHCPIEGVNPQPCPSQGAKRQ